MIEDTPATKMGAEHSDPEAKSEAAEAEAAKHHGDDTTTLFPDEEGPLSHEQLEKIKARAFNAYQDNWILNATAAVQMCFVLSAYEVQKFGRDIHIFETAVQHSLAHKLSNMQSADAKELIAFIENCNTNGAFVEKLGIDLYDLSDEFCRILNIQLPGHAVE